MAGFGADIALKTRLGLAAAALGAVTVQTAALLYFGMAEVADRLDAALAAEARSARYATLSTQASTFIVVAAEAVQSGLDADTRADRIAPVTGQIDRTFAALRADVETAVEDARALGLDAQSRFGTQSLGLARMEALLRSTLTGLTTPGAPRERLQAHIDTFATGFDPLLNQAVNTELLFRRDILAGIDALRRQLMLGALAMAGASLLLVAGTYFGMIRPQFRRLDRLRDAARQIGQEDFAITLPRTRPDEIGQLYSETNRMAAALAARQARVEEEWTRLNDTIAARTRELSAANARLEEIDENRRRFFADVSHELRTPLTVILMEAQIGRKAAAPGAENAFATIEARAERLNRRIDDLLRVARSESGQLALDPQPFNLADAAREAQAETRAEVENAGMLADLTGAGPLPVVADRNWLRQVIVSLIRNAIRHARDGGRVTLALSGDSGMAEVAVIDNGPGIAPADRGRIFDRFAQGPVNRAQGFGIGLALARWVIEEQGGTIAVASPAPGTGTAIAIRLPLAQD